MPQLWNMSGHHYVDSSILVLKSHSSLYTYYSGSPRDIITLLEKCLKCTYFLHKGQYYLQVHGAAMGSPVSDIVCNLYMENFEQITLAKAENPPRWWKRYVDDTYTVLRKDQAQKFSDYLNTVDEDIKWTSLLVHPKDKTDPKEGVYTIDCAGCPKKYVGETKRKLKVRVKEHRTETEKVIGTRDIRDRKRQSETEMWGSAITDNAMKENHIIDWTVLRLWNGREMIKLGA